MRRLAQYAETCDLNRVEMGDTKLGIITSSTSYQYVKEVFGEEASVLKLGMVHPLPEGLILDFAAKVDRLLVVEELDPIIEKTLPSAGPNRFRQGGPASGGGVLPEPGGRKAGRYRTYRQDPGGRHSSPAPGHVRRLPPPGTVLHPEQK